MHETGILIVRNVGNLNTNSRSMPGNVCFRKQLTGKGSGMSPAKYRVSG